MKKKLTRKKMIKNATSLTLGVGLMLSSFQATYIGPAPKAGAAAVSTTKAESILANLTPAQRQALNQLSTFDQSGLFLSPDINLESPENVSVIIQFNSKPHKVAVLEAALKGDSLSESQAKSLVDADHTTFDKDLKALSDQKGTTYKISREFKNAFNGVSIKLPANKIKSLLNSKAVKAIYSNAEVQVEEPVSKEAPSTEAAVHGMSAENNFLNVNKLHEEGFTGKGIKIAVLDTGVDYNHPDISPAYKGYRAQPNVDPKTIDPNSVKGWDFVDNDADPMETTYEDWIKAGKPNGQNNGKDYYTDHGTHVSGTIVGQGENESDYATTGIAPDAELYVYRVLGPGGGGLSDGIVAGIEKAVKDGVDIMNLSLGANYNDPLTAQAIAVNNAVLSGVTAVVAAGNAGNGMYTLGNPGNASLALTVGASDVPTELQTMKSTVDDKTADLRLMATGFTSDLNTLLSPSQPLQIVNLGLGSSFNYFGANARVDGKIVLVQRGSNTINDKILQAKNRGAVGVIIINTNAAEGHLPFNLGEGSDFIPTFSMTYSDGLALVQNFPVNSTETISFSDLGKIGLSGDNLADFSSRGPSRVTYDIKPEITAPGVSVLSTIPGFVNNNSNPTDYQYAYQRMSGTSMATPAVAGISALLLQAKPDLQPEDVKAILMNTADSLSKPYSVFETGAGRVDPYEAIHSDFEIKVEEKFPTIINNKERLVKENTGAISFGNKAYNGKDTVDTRSATLFNKGEKEKTFDVKVTFNSNVRGSKDAEANGVTFKTDSTVKIKGNSKKETSVTLTIPKSAEKGIYEGYIVYTNQNDPSESYQVPFGVHFVEPGFDYFKIYKRSTPESLTRSSQKWARGNDLNVSLKSHMKTIDAIISDPKTGEDLGYLGSFYGTLMSEGVDYAVGNFYKGYYYPFTDDPENPIGTREDQLVVPKAGQYQFKLIGQDDDGKIYTVTQDFFVDGTKPKWGMHIEGEIPGKQIVEYKEGQDTLDVTAHISDDNVALKQAAGMNADQTQNQIYYSYNSWLPNGNMTLDKDGNASDEIAMMPELQVLSVKFEGMDEATNGYLQKQYYFVNEHTPYVSVEANKQTKFDIALVNPGDAFTMTLNANNVSKLLKANYKFSDANGTKITNISLNPEAQKLGGSLDVKQTTSGSTISSDVTVTFNGAAGINGDIPMVDLTIQIPKPLAPSMAQTFDWTGVKSTFTNVDNVITKPFTNVSPISILNDQTEIKGYVRGQAFLDAKGNFDFARDYSKISPTLTIVDSNGKEVKTDVVAKNGSFDIIGLEPSNEDYTFIQDIPGHFNTYKKFNTQFELDGEIYGSLFSVGIETTPYATAGDVNKDDVIDIMDALTIQEHWGTNKRGADINFDGTVDEKDFAFVEKNFLKKNPWISAPPKPVETYKGKTLESIKKLLGLQ